MLNLNYIIVIGLPKREIGYLEENLRQEIDRSAGCRVFFYMIGNRSMDCAEIEDGTDNGKKESSGTEQERMLDGKEIFFWRDGMRFLEEFSQFPTEESLVISGERSCLHLAEVYRIAALGYTGRRQEIDSAEHQSEEAEAAMADMYAEGFEEIGWVFLRHVYERHHHLPWTILETERCVVKEFSMEYLPDLFELYAGEGMTDYIEPLYEYEKEKEYQKAYIENMYRFYGYGMWIVCEKKTGRLIGRAGVEHREVLEGELELGYAVGTPYQNQGYAAEVCRAILDYVKQELQFERVYCLIEAGNQRSIHLAEKLGFSYCGKMFLEGKQMMKYVCSLSESSQEAAFIGQR